jgi:hypothetical protein
MPFGGYKQSGIGRELGNEGMELFMETKSVSLKLNYRPSLGPGTLYRTSPVNIAGFLVCSA